jgi:hypothetical protein
MTRLGDAGRRGDAPVGGCSTACRACRTRRCCWMDGQLCSHWPLQRRLRSAWSGFRFASTPDRREWTYRCHCLDQHRGIAAAEQPELLIQGGKDPPRRRGRPRRCGADRASHRPSSPPACAVVTMPPSSSHSANTPAAPRGTALPAACRVVRYAVVRSALPPPVPCRRTWRRDGWRARRQVHAAPAQRGGGLVDHRADPSWGGLSLYARSHPAVTPLSNNLRRTHSTSGHMPLELIDRLYYSRTSVKY